jgi:4-aminobutyrate aminotransferase
VTPIAAIITRAGLDVAGEVALGHHTHQKSPLGSAAALATLDVIENEGLLERARQLGAVTDAEPARALDILARAVAEVSAATPHP